MNIGNIAISVVLIGLTIHALYIHGKIYEFENGLLQLEAMVDHIYEEEDENI